MPGFDPYFFAAMFALVAVLTYHVRKFVGWSGAALFFVCGFQAIRIFASTVSPYANTSGHFQTAFDALSAGSFAMLTAVVFAVGLLPLRFLGRVRFGFTLAALFSSLSAVFLGHGFLHQKAIDSMAIALLLPSAIELHPALAVPIVAGVFMLKASTGMIIAAVVVAFYLREFWYFTLTMLLCFVVSVGPQEFVSSTGRFDEWRMAFSYWRENVGVLGSGSGTFFLLGPLIDLQHAKPDAWTWLHNDWLQILFEQGAAGLLAVVVFFLAALRAAWGRPGIFVSVLVYGVAACTQMPVRIAVTAVWGAVLARITFAGKVR